MAAYAWTWLLIAASLSIAAANIQVNVHWTHDNGSDLMLPAREFAKMAEEARGEAGIDKRNAIKDWRHLWYMGTVYYDIDARTADFRLLQILAPAFQFFKQYTCIRWKRRLPEDYKIRDYVIFSMPQAGTRLCNSAVGRQTGRQYINLDSECVKSLAEVLHQMTHALGFYHMHSRADRDKYIQINPANALPQNRQFFDKDPPNVADSMGFPYEHKSLMHFDGFKYAAGSKPTIVSKVPGVLLGNKQALTVQDVTMINTLYAQCKRSCRFSNGLCDHKCFENKPGDVYCDCIKGYRLNSDKKTCFDVDECAEQNGGCDHMCTTHGAWYKCECRTHYSLDKNGYTCRANDRCEDGSLRCQQECLFNQCACKKGYTLNSDGLTCDDVDECGVYNGGCEEKCFNTPGSYYCECRKGAFVSNDGKTCTDLTCPTLAPVPNAEVNCTTKASVEGTVCQYTCNRGFKLVGDSETSCSNRKWSTRPPACEATDRCALDNGGCEQLCWANSWDNVKCSCKIGFRLEPNGVNCKDIEPPTITKCPNDIYTNTVPKKSWASVTWNLPTFYDNVEASITSGPVMQDKIGGVYDIGDHLVEYVITDTAGNSDSCTFKIKVLDVERPDMFNCPGPRSFQASPLEKFIEADWEDPGFWDNSEVEVKVTTDLPANRHIDPRTQDIHYIATDQSGNSVVCTISVTVVVKETSCDAFPYEPFGGYMKCDSFIFGSQCRPICRNKYDLTRDGASAIYSCSNKQWIPKPKQFECPATEKPIKAPALVYKFTYKASCTQSSVDSLKPFATSMATNNIKLLCPKAGDTCKLTVGLECTGDYVVMRVYTTEPLTPPISGRFLSTIKSNIMKQQKGFFFYMPLGGVILPPQPDADGAKAIPDIELLCKNGAIVDRTQLKCYARSS